MESLRVPFIETSLYLLQSVFELLAPVCSICIFVFAVVKSFPRLIPLLNNFLRSELTLESCSRFCKDGVGITL